MLGRDLSIVDGDEEERVEGEVGRLGARVKKQTRGGTKDWQRRRGGEQEE